MVGFERMSRILMDVKGKQGRPEGDCDDNEGVEKEAASILEEK